MPFRVQTRPRRADSALGPNSIPALLSDWRRWLSPLWRLHQSQTQDPPPFPLSEAPKPEAEAPVNVLSTALLPRLSHQMRSAFWFFAEVELLVLVWALSYGGGFRVVPPEAFQRKPRCSAARSVCWWSDSETLLASLFATLAKWTTRFLCYSLHICKMAISLPLQWPGCGPAAADRIGEWRRQGLGEAWDPLVPLPTSLQPITIKF